MEADKILTSKRGTHKGFTLPEMLVVLSLIAVLAAVFLLQLSPMLKKTDKAADAASLKTLNSATNLYKTLNNSTSGGDIFEGLTTDPERLTALFEEGYIDRIPVPNVENNSFSWDIADQKWTMAYTSAPEPATDSHVVTASEIVIEESGGRAGVITGTYSGDEKDIVIPAEINGIPVTSIYQDVFKDKALTSVVIEEGITRIHARAFKDNELTEIILPNSLTRIDWGAFSGNDLTKITIGQGVYLEGSVFPYHSSFTAAYSAGGAGTYVLTGGVWGKQ